MLSLNLLLLLALLTITTVLATPFTSLRSSLPVDTPRPAPGFRHTNFHTELRRQYSLGLRSPPAQTGNVSTFTLEQPLDHFDRLNTGRYNQTYWVNTQYATQCTQRTPLPIPVCA